MVVASNPQNFYVPCVEPHTVYLMALPDPYVAITFDGVVTRRQARYLCKEWTWHIGQWTEEKIICSVETELLFSINTCSYSCVYARRT